MTKQKYTNNQTIIQQGKQGNTFFLIKKGSVKIIKNNIFIREIGEGSCFGEMALFQDENNTNKIRTASVVAVGNVSCFILSKENFETILQNKLIKQYITEKIAIQKNKLIQYESQYSEAEKVAAQQEIAHLEMTSDILVKKGQDYDKLNTSSQTAYDTIISKLQDVKNSDGSIKKTKIELIEMIDNIQDLGKQDGNLNTLKKALLGLPDSL